MSLDGLARATTEHVVPRVKGGPSWVENEVAACRRCNGARGHLTPAEWLEECERRGWEPNRAAIVAALHALDEAIARRGGQRRARPYLASQVRRLGRSTQREGWRRDDRRRGDAITAAVPTADVAVS